MKPSDFIRIVLCLGLLYFATACIVWQWRNPTANNAAVWQNISRVLRFQP